MQNLWQKIKDKISPQPDFDLDDDEVKNEDEEEIVGEEAEVDLGGPEIGSEKKNKTLVIAASSLLITVVIYFLFFKGANETPKKLETVSPNLRPESVARSEDGKSPFELQDLSKNQQDESFAILEKPEAPDIPELPEVKDIAANVQDLIISSDRPEVQNEVAKQQPEPVVTQAQIPAAIKPEPQKLPDQNSKKEKEVTAPVQPKITDPRYAPIIVLQGQDGPSSSVGYDNNIQVLNADEISSLKKTDAGVEAEYLADRQNVVAQGKLINAVLETAINTENPGAVRAIISRDVYAEAGSKVLIPRGSRLYGAYSAEILRGEARVQINWTRLIRPDGVSLAISSFASDQFGRAGIAGVVNNKYGDAIKNSLLVSLLTVAGAAAVDGIFGDDNNSTTTVDPNNGTSTITSNATIQATNDLTNNVNQLSSRFVNEYFDSRPLITVPQGTRITVLVNSDIKMPESLR